MLTILHGEHHVKSRDALTQQFDQARQNGKTVVKLGAKQLDPQSLQNALQSQSLFGEERHIFIEELHSLPKSKKRDELIQIIKAAATENEITLWEKKLLSATDIKAFPGSRATAFPLAKVMFTWLGAITGDKSATAKTRMLKLMQQTIDSDGEQFAFAMLSRQVRLLMEAKDSAESANPRTVSQARSFSWPQLFQLHKELLLIDRNFKTSATALTVTNQLELLFVTL